MLTSCLAIFHWVPTGIESETGTARNTCLSSQVLSHATARATPSALLTRGTWALCRARWVGEVPHTCRDILSYSPLRSCVPKLGPKTPSQAKGTNKTTTEHWHHRRTASRLSHRADKSSDLYFTSLKLWFESSSSMSSQRHNAAGHGDDSLSSSEAELCASKALPGLHRRGVLHPAG